MLDATMTRLGDFLQAELEQRGLSWRAAAAKLDMSYSTLRRVLVGLSDPPELPTLQKIAAGLGLSLARLQDLAGYAPGADADGIDELRGLTDEQRAFLRGLSPARKRELIDSIRRILGV